MANSRTINLNINRSLENRAMARINWYIIALVILVVAVLLFLRLHGAAS